MKYNSAIKTNEMLMHAVKQMNSENIRLKELRHKSHTVRFYFYKVPSIDKLHKDRKEIVGFGNLGENGMRRK